MVAAVIMKLTEYIINGAAIMLLNLPGDSSLKWGAGRVLLHVAPHFLYLFCICLKLTCFQYIDTVGHQQKYPVCKNLVCTTSRTGGI